MDYSKFRLRSFKNLRSKYALGCGSYFELPTKYCEINKTDADIMFYYYDICAIPWNRNPPKNAKCTVLRIDSKQTPPGFARLMVDQESTEDNPTYFRRPSVLRDIQTGGPSKPCEHRSTRAFSQINHHATTSLTSFSIDNVFSVYCPYWPLEAEEWRKRKRIHGWPNEKLIATITRGGCHFVSKLRTWSTCDDTEWRFSFSKAELLLIHSWTPDQKLAYHYIRLVKRRLSEYCGSDGNKGFQTYYFKTLLLWACEEFTPEFWTKQNAGTYIVILLHRFIRCLNEKFCPNYFIPECNIMSHLKDEGNFEKELLMARKFLAGKFNIVVAYDTSQDDILVYTAPFEYKCFNEMWYSLALIENFNRHCAQYLSDCEWFLPEMKNLHAAIEAHLRLMSVDSVSERQTSTDYAVSDENFNTTLLERKRCELYERLYGDMSETENWNRIFIRKLIRNTTSVYYRMCLKGDWYHELISESYTPILYGVTSAYRANFYFTAMKSYSEALAECKKCLEVLNNETSIRILNHNPLEHSSHILVLVCNSLSQIFDEHLQVILGFATLHRNISFSNSPVTATSHEVCLKLYAWKFLNYIGLQCLKKLYPMSEPSDTSISDDLDLFRPYMSQIIDSYVFNMVLLFAALKLSGA